jgi:hypothetical protein
MWGAVRVVSMLVLGATAMVNMLVSLLLFLGAGMAGVIANSEHGTKAAGDVRDSLAQEAGAVGLTAVGAFIVIAFVSNKERYLAPVLGAGVIAAEIWFGVRFGFTWLPNASIAGAALAIAGWGGLHLEKPRAAG